MNTQILAPASVLIIWSLLILLWMGATRLPALKKLNVLENAKPGGRGQDLDGVLPDQMQWKAHNYMHLMEQPTLFYAVTLILALAGADQTDIVLAWLYVLLRILHSLWQTLVNTIPVRLTLFTLGTIILLIMAIRALVITL